MRNSTEPKIISRPSTKDLRELPALSLKQPWATWAVLGFKTIEYRSWRIRTPQTILIHATKLLPRRELEEMARDLVDIMEDSYERILHELLILPTSSVVGKVTVVKCVEDKEDPKLFNWHLRDPVFYSYPYECPGGLKLFRVKLRKS